MAAAAVDVVVFRVLWEIVLIFWFGFGVAEDEKMSTRRANSTRVVVASKHQATVLQVRCLPMPALTSTGFFSHPLLRAINGAVFVCQSTLRRADGGDDAAGGGECCVCCFVALIWCGIRVGAIQATKGDVGA